MNTKITILAVAYAILVVTQPVFGKSGDTIPISGSEAFLEGLEAKLGLALRRRKAGRKPVKRAVQALK